MQEQEIFEKKLTIEDLEKAGISTYLDTLKMKEHRAQTFSFWTGILLFILTISLCISVYLLTDDSVFYYKAPTVYDVKNVQRLTRVKDVSLAQIERGLYDFVRRYIKARYPKSAKNVEEYYKFIVNHSVPTIQYDFEGRLQSIEKIKRELEVGSNSSVYVRSMDDIRIQKHKSLSEWSISIPIRKVIRGGRSGGERYDAVISMDVAYTNPTQTNDGFIVKRYEEIVTTSEVTNEKIKVVGE